MTKMEETVGEVQNLTPSFNWKIVAQNLFQDMTIGRYSSPCFTYGAATWCLGIHFTTSVVHSTRFISLYLQNVKSEFQTLVVTFVINISDEDGNVYKRYNSNNVEFFEGSRSCVQVIEQSKFFEDLCLIPPNGYLTLSCTFSKSVEMQGQFSPDSSKGYHIRIKRKIRKDKNIKNDPSDEFKEDSFRNKRGVDKLLQDIKGLLFSGQDSDVILTVKDREFRVHKAILGARSPVFCSMFRHDMLEKSKGIVEIPEIDPDTFQSFLLHLYTGKIEDRSNNLIHLYSAADKYIVEDLKAECLEIVTQDLSVDNFCDVTALSLRHSDSALLETAMQFFKKNISRIVVTDKWLSFMKDNHVAANQLYIKALDLSPESKDNIGI